MECPECGNKMFKNDDIWVCSNCGYTYVKNNNDNIFSKINASNISNKINHYRENNETAGKIIKGVGNVAEQVSIQAKKEHAYIKSRNDNDSTALVDDNEFFISKTVFDGVEYLTNKKQEFEDERLTKNQNESVKTENIEDDSKQNNNNQNDDEEKRPWGLGRIIVNKGNKILEEEKREIHEKIPPLLPEYAEILGVKPDECYVTYITGSFLFRGTKHRGRTQEGVVMAIHDNRISYISFQYRYGKFKNILENNDDVNVISFKNISSISDSPRLIKLNMVGGGEINIKPIDYFDKEIGKELHEKYNNFISNSTVSETNKSQEVTNKADELLKYAELYKQGLLTEEEFEAKKKELL